MRNLILFAAITTLGLSCVDSDNVSWVFISSTGVSTASGGAVLIIRKATDGPTGGDAYRLEVAGLDHRGAVTVHLATMSDTAILEYADRVDISSPMLSELMIELANAQFEIRSNEAGIGVIVLPDANTVDPAAFGLGRLHIASRGSALVLEHQGGMIAYSLGDPPMFFPAGSSLETSGSHFAITTPEGRVTVVLPGRVPTEGQRFERNQGWIRLFGPRGGVTATLPEDQLQFGLIGSGIYLTGSFPNGLSSTDTKPVELVVAELNRHLLRIEDG